MSGIEIAAVAPMKLQRSPTTVIARLSARKAVRSGLLWGAIFGVSIASAAISYASIYKTQAERNALAATYGSNNATSALFGPAPGLQTVAGFTVFKVSMMLMILGAVWGLLTSTKMLRGEEEMGRWELLLAGQVTPKRALTQVLAGLSLGMVTFWALTAAITVATGTSAKIDIAPGPALFFALAEVSAAAIFLAVGALTSQLGATRRQAAAYATLILGVSYAIRMLADAGLGVHFLVWLSPLGWVEELRPLTNPAPLALVPIALSIAILAFLARYLAGRRDVGAAIVAERDASPPRLGLLMSPLGLSTRISRSVATGWWVAIAVTGLLYGMIAKSAGATVSGASMKEVLSKLGATGSGVTAILGVCFLIMAVMVGFAAAGQMTSVRSEEASGRLENLLVRPVSRSRWLSGRLLVAMATIFVAAMLAGIFAWAGAATQDSGLGFKTALDAGLNITFPALAIIGIGTLALGVAPRSLSTVVYIVLGWSLLVEIVGGIGAVSHWVLDTSLFHQMASTPAVAPNWQANLVMGAVGILTATAGGIAFRHRDLAGE